MQANQILIQPSAATIVMTIMVAAIMDQAMVKVITMQVTNIVATVLLPTPGMGLLFM